MFEATLSIDLGASYTKVVYRPACVPQEVGTIQREAKVLMESAPPPIIRSSLIPSLAIRTRDKAKPWVFGWEAAALNPDASMSVFQNWKADLFRPHNDKDSVAAAIIAHRFFDWLRLNLESKGIDVRACQTRIAMPAFDTFDENALLVARCLDLSGWNDPTLILKVREPHANAIGLFAAGKNVVMRNVANEMAVNYGQMFGQDNPYIQAARGFALLGNHTNLLTVLVVDIGAFTTDFAKLTFDFTKSADGLSAIKQESHALGIINELDKPLFKAIETRHGFSWSSINFFQREDVKNKLYQGNPYPLQTRVANNPKIIELGDAGDLEIIEKAANIFSASILKKITPFIATETPSHVYLTGGGSLISYVAKNLKSAFADLKIQVVPVDKGDGAIGTEEQRPWRNTGEGLQRLATAVGGASVILQEAAAPVQQDRAGLQQLPPIVAHPPEGYKTCRCQGGNKDCCFCGGRGFYPNG